MTTEYKVVPTCYTLKNPMASYEATTHINIRDIGTGPFIALIQGENEIELDLEELELIISIARDRCVTS